MLNRVLVCSGKPRSKCVSLWPELNDNEAQKSIKYEYKDESNDNR